MLEQEVEKLLIYKPEPDLFDWAVALDFFDEHRYILTECQKEALYYRCEWYRKYFNKRHEIKKIVQGKEATFYRYGLNIQKESVTPNIYSYYTPPKQHIILDSIDNSDSIDKDRQFLIPLAAPT